MPVKASVETVFWKAVDLVLPPRCVVTGAAVGKQGALAPDAWAALRFIAPPHCLRCGFPFDFGMAFSEGVCGGCLKESPPFETARAALVYDDASRDMILKFKHADQTYAVHAFLPWLERVGAEMLAQADYIVPVPLHRSRLLRRRYNQAALLAQALAKDCGLPCLPGVLQRRRATPSQGNLGYKERYRNVAHAFAVVPRYAPKIRNKTIVLVDDVYTTGATVKECTKVLLKAGAARVHVLAVARVVRPDVF